MSIKRWIVVLVFLGLCGIASWIIPAMCRAESGTYSLKQDDTVFYLKFEPGPFGPGEQGQARLYKTVDDDIEVFFYSIDADRPYTIWIDGIGVFEKLADTIELFVKTGIKMQRESSE